ncbi:unnamed protein product [Symbiodinium sp. CCMP2592]|nr:unnamed protein product [Symbiodinium sp. CCMP2592]CAE7623512.1 unnamed protein product [Symbiodinium sp. CCMP2592]CAE7677258.1 unnamed protein product [Symbiodinium sp. CCMP2592]
MIWSYINGVDAEADNHMPSLGKVAQIDGRFPWAFVQAPSFCVVGEWVGGKKMSPAMSDALQQSGFLVASDRSSLAELPEAMATGSLLSKLAAKRFRVEHPGAKKARHIPACIQGPSPGIYLLASAALRCGNQLSARRACVTAAGQHVQMRPSELREMDPVCVTAAYEGRADAAAVLCGSVCATAAFETRAAKWSTPDV